MKTATAFIATGLGFAAIDSIWLITMSTRLYKPEIGEMMAENFRLGPAIVFYLLYITGILVFAVQPALALTMVPHNCAPQSASLTSTLPDGLRNTP